MNNATVNFSVPPPEVSIKAVAMKDVIDTIDATRQLTDEVKEAALDVLDKHSADSFSSLEELLGIGFSPEVVEALKICNELLQLFC